MIEDLLRDGLDPNVLWDEKDLIVSQGSHLENLWMHWNTPLHLAIRVADYDSAEVILRCGGHVDICNAAGHTALREAIDHNRSDSARFLLRHGADPNRPSPDSQVPLHLALRNGDEDLFFDLINAGATVEAARHFEWSIADLVLLASERSILARLIDEFWMLPTPLFCSHQAPQSKTPEELASLARQLLAIMSSSRVLPPEPLYEAYRFVLSTAMPKYPKDKPRDRSMVDNLVESVVSGLSEVSGTPRLHLNEKFCPGCLEFQAVVRRTSRNPETDTVLSTPKTEIHKNKAELEQCALTGCPLCTLIADSLYTEIGYEFCWTANDNSCPQPELSPITLTVTKTFVTPSPEFPLRIRRMSNIEARLTHPKNLFITFDLKEFNVEFGKFHELESAVDTTGAPHALSVARQWLETCRTSPAHSKCRQAYRNISDGGPLPALPTRVIHVGSESQDPYLIESNGVRARYCILSYCWGRPGTAITTKENKSERQKGIPLASLPAFIHEAILAARSLDFQYIWIDALCIIQNDSDDWAREASRMHELYAWADLTITSLVAGDSRDNLFQPRPQRMRTCRPIPLHLELSKWNRPDFEKNAILELAVYPDHRLVQQTPFFGPVDDRAWILQEQVMSTRLLYFGAGMLHWECLDRYVLEPNPCFHEHTNFSFGKRCNDKLAIKSFDLGASYRTPLDIWKSYVRSFTGRKLTKPSDRIPAFLAISKALGKVLNDDFIGGIWTGDNILESLCWRLLRPDTSEPSSPTWTWASRSGQVDYDTFNREAKREPKASVMACDATSNQAQSCIYGSITLKGTLTLLHNPHYISGHYDHECGKSTDCYTLDLIAFGKSSSRISGPITPNINICH